MPRIGTREANFMPIADRQTRISLLWLPAFVPLWLAGCGAYGGGGNGGGGGGAGAPAPPGLSATAAEAPGDLTLNANGGAPGHYVKRPTSGGTRGPNATQRAPALHRQSPNPGN